MECSDHSIDRYNRNFSRKVRESIAIDEHSTRNQVVSHWIIRRSTLSLLWQIDFSSLRAQDIIMNLLLFRFDIDDLTVLILILTFKSREHTNHILPI